MDYRDDFDLAREYSGKALELMEQHNVPIHPHNFEVWYAYASRLSVALIKQIDERIDAGISFDEEFNRTIYESCILEAPAAHLAMDVSERLAGEIDKILRLIDATSDNSTELGKAARQACDGLAGNPSPQKVLAAVEALISASQNVESRSRELEERLQDTRGEVESLRENLEEARSEARTDGLTGIANRKAFDEGLMREMLVAMENGSPLCLLMVDIDHFKAFNDKWGHRVGDQVLRLAASCIETNIKGKDTAARYGGEEFAVILPNTTLQDAVVLADQIRTTVQSRELVKKATGESLGKITISLGAAEFRLGEPLSELIERADACLYQAKRSGRNRSVAETATEFKPRVVAG